jgi:hypothetical protein
MAKTFKLLSPIHSLYLNSGNGEEKHTCQLGILYYNKGNARFDLFSISSMKLQGHICGRALIEDHACPRVFDIGYGSTFHLV